MPLISLSDTQMLIVLFLGSLIIQISGALIARQIKFDENSTKKWLYKTREWEKQGVFYKKYTFVHKWKKFLPDGARFFKNDFRKKHLLAADREYVEKFIAESCRAELAHWLGMLPFILFFVFVYWYVALIMVFYGIIVNLPCIIAQRYNRPRLKKLLNNLD
ncbi:MAG: glycosyl-4,4'-diaponeurosporenoate acyltransferase [Bacillota bacterium]